MKRALRWSRTEWALSWRAVLLLIMLQVAGCQVQPHDKSNESRVDRTMPSRDINAVLRDHDDELMAIPGVVGVFVGLLQDGKTPCLKVMAARKTPALERKIPVAGRICGGSRRDRRHPPLQ